MNKSHVKSNCNEASNKNEECKFFIILCNYSKEHEATDDISESALLRNMFRVLIVKFIGNRGLMELLINTGDDKLVEGNDWGDTFWGICEGKGHNHLGEMLMTIRSGFKVRHETNK
jgi:hypothetical protein